MLLRQAGTWRGSLRCESNVYYCIKCTCRLVYQAHLAEAKLRPGKWHSVCLNMPRHTSQVTHLGGVLAELCRDAVHTTLVGKWAIFEKPDLWIHKMTVFQCSQDSLNTLWCRWEPKDCFAPTTGLSLHGNSYNCFRSMVVVHDPKPFAHTLSYWWDFNLA